MVQRLASLNVDNEQTVPPARHPGRIRDEEPPEPRSSRFGFWFAMICLAGALVGGALYLYPRLAEYGSQLNGLHGALAGIRERMGETERRVGELSPEIESFKANLADAGRRLEQKLNSGMEQARKSTQDLAASLRREMLEAIGAQEKAADLRFRDLEARQQTEAMRSARLEQQVAQLNRQLAGLTQDVDDKRNASARESEVLRNQVQQADNRLDRVSSFQDRPRERFEVSRGKSERIAPGIYLHVTRTDPRYRRYQGWLQVVNDGKIVWLRDKSVLEAVTFHAGQRNGQYDLVVTALNQGGVAGYLILPSVGESGAQATGM